MGVKEGLKEKMDETSERDRAGKTAWCIKGRMKFLKSKRDGDSEGWSWRLGGLETRLDNRAELAEIEMDLRSNPAG